MCPKFRTYPVLKHTKCHISANLSHFLKLCLLYCQKLFALAPTNRRFAERNRLGGNTDFLYSWSDNLLFSAFFFSKWQITTLSFLLTWHASPFIAGHCRINTRIFQNKNFFGIPLSKNHEIFWLFLKFIQICDGEKFVIKKFIVLMQLTVYWSDPYFFKQIWNISAVKIKFKCPGIGKFFHAVWFSRNLSLRRFAAKALRLSQERNRQRNLFRRLFKQIKLCMEVVNYDDSWKEITLVLLYGFLCFDTKLLHLYWTQKVAVYNHLTTLEVFFRFFPINYYLFLGKNVPFIHISITWRGCKLFYKCCYSFTSVSKRTTS